VGCSASAPPCSNAQRGANRSLNRSLAASPVVPSDSLLHPFLVGFPTVTRKFRGDRMDDVNRYLKDGGDFFDR